MKHNNTAESVLQQLSCSGIVNKKWHSCRRVMGEEGIMERHMYTRNTISKKALSSRTRKRNDERTQSLSNQRTKTTLHTQTVKLFFQLLSYKVPIFLKKERKRVSSQSITIRESVNLLTYIGVSRKNIWSVSRKI